MNPWSMAGWGFGPGCMLGTKHLFGEQSGSSAVCLRQLFPQCPIFPPPRTSCSHWLMGQHAVTSSTPGRDSSDGDSWSRMEFVRRERIRGQAGRRRKSAFLLFTPSPSLQLQMNLQAKRGGRAVYRSGWRKCWKRLEKWNASFQFTRPYTYDY